MRVKSLNTAISADILPAYKCAKQLGFTKLVVNFKGIKVTNYDSDQ